MLYAVAIDYSSLSMQDNAKSNTGRLVGNFLEAETMQRMEWPAFSADRNPIEHVWDTPGDACPQDQGLLLMSKTWRTHIVKSERVFPKITSMTSSHPC
ncbi:hypothetical protein TNCV_803841 [Trichonephila clavipes]|nr:hypothetical protein TNCV_803841 [Trichonephila clavipes]